MIHCQCQCGWNLYGANPFQIACPKCKTVNQCGDEFVPRVDRSETLANAGREHWRRLHAFPFSGDWDCSARCKWWADWQASIPNIGCSCRKHWSELIATCPPDFSSPEAFFLWSVGAHNIVNVRLGKPIMPYAEAWQLYGHQT